MRQQEMNHRRQLQYIRREERARLTATKRAARAEEMALRRQSRARQQFRQATMRDMGRRVRGSVGAVGRYGALTAGMAGGFAMAGALEHHRSLDRDTRVLAIQASRATGGDVEGFRARFRDRAKALGARGEGAAAVVGGMRRYQALTGDPEGALNLAERFTDLATSSGAEIEDVAATAGEAMLLLQQRGLSGAAALGELDKILLNLTAQGAMGSIEFAEFAQVMGKVGASTAAFKDMPVADIVSMMSAFGQISKRGGAASGAEAATSLMRMADDMVKNADKFAKLRTASGKGIDVFTYDEVGGKKVRGGLRNPLEVYADVLEATGGDIAKIQDLFGVRGAKAAKSVMGIATNLGGGDLKAGIDAMRKEVERFQKAKLTPDQVRRDAELMRRGTDMQMSAAMEKFNIEVGPAVARAMTQLIPAFQKLIPVVADAAEALADIVSWASENPYDGIAALIAGLVAKDIAGAAIGAAIRAAMVAQIGGGGAGAAASGTAKGLAPAAAAGGASLGTFVAGAAASLIGSASMYGQSGREAERALGGGGKTGGAIGTGLGVLMAPMTGGASLLGAVGGAGAKTAGTEESFTAALNPFSQPELRKGFGGLAPTIAPPTPPPIAPDELYAIMSGGGGAGSKQAAAEQRAAAGDQKAAAGEQKASAGQMHAAATTFLAGATLFAANAGKGGGGGPNRGDSPTVPRQ
jgi:hypothetical protein